MKNKILNKTVDVLMDAPKNAIIAIFASVFFYAALSVIFIILMGIGVNNDADQFWKFLMNNLRWYFIFITFFILMIADDLGVPNIKTVFSKVMRKIKKCGEG